MAVSKIVDATSAPNSMNQWIENFGNKYFDFQQANNYRTGIFGYCNELMSSVNEDTFNAVATVRREFYPNTALYTESLYTMGALQEIDAPLYSPAKVKTVLIIKESDILPKLINNNEYIIDDKCIFMVDNIPFMVLHPIIITGIKNSKSLHGKEKETYTYTIRYDNSYSNSLDDSNQIYLQNKVIISQGERIILITATLTQVSMELMEENITKNAHIDVVTYDFPVSGNLASFEIWYQENENSKKIQLKKVLMDTDTPNEDPFCMYMLTDDHNLRIHFPSNIYFTPKFNSKISLRIYTTLGEDGNFEHFSGSILCNNSLNSYPDTNSIIIDGQTMGESKGGKNRDANLSFRKETMYAYATNKSLTTNNDLQKYFDKMMLDYNNKIIFFKQRDDAFARIFGAYMLLKDNEKRIIPCNTLNMILNQGIIGNTNPSGLSDDSDFDQYYESTDRLILKPGAVFRYSDDNLLEDFTIKRDKSISINDKLKYEIVSKQIHSFLLTLPISNEGVIVNEINSDRFEIFNITEENLLPLIIKNILDICGMNITSTYQKYIRIKSEMDNTKGRYVSLAISYFLFTNPFLISVLRKPNAIGYYINSINESIPFEYTEVANGNDSYIQFLLNNMKVVRNSIIGENFYKFTATITPSIIEEDINSIIFSPVDITKEENIKRAKSNGYVSSLKYYNENIEKGINYPGVYAELSYDDNTKELIYISSTVYGDGNDFVYRTGYKLLKDVSETFNKNDEIAYKKITDLGCIRLMMIINNKEFTENDGRYIPLVLEDVDVESNYYTFSAYVATDDEIGSNGTMHFTRGVYNKFGTEENNKEVTVSTNNMKIDLVSFIHYNDNNVPGKWGSYAYIMGAYTFTNQFSIAETYNNFSLIKTIAYIRSTALVDYKSPEPNNLQAPNGITTYTLKSIPMIKAQWVSFRENSNYLSNAILSNYNFITDVYNKLENGFSIDLKFYNTYGRSRFYKVGIGDDTNTFLPLDRVNSSFNFGVKLDTLSSTSDFSERFIIFIKNYIESLTDVVSFGKPIYIMNMIASIKENFDEISFLEYYGINQYKDSVQQIVSSYDEDVLSLGYNEYVPEFINIDTNTDIYNQNTPAISIKFLK